MKSWGSACLAMLGRIRELKMIHFVEGDFKTNKSDSLLFSLRSTAAASPLLVSYRRLFTFVV